MQTQETIGMTLSQTFVMVDNGITVYTSDGSLYGVSKFVPSENGPLSFLIPAGDSAVDVAEVYCNLVSCELRISRSTRKSNLRRVSSTRETGSPLPLR